MKHAKRAFLICAWPHSKHGRAVCSTVTMMLWDREIQRWVSEGYDYRFPAYGSYVLDRAKRIVSKWENVPPAIERGQCYAHVAQTADEAIGFQTGFFIGRGLAETNMSRFLRNECLN
jgi:hypothetical protein